MTNLRHLVAATGRAVVPILCGSSHSVALSLPLGFRHSPTVIDDASEDEEQVGQAIHVAQQHRIDRRIERDHPALGAAADRPRHVEGGAGRRAARENEPAKTIADISGGRG